MVARAWAGRNRKLTPWSPIEADFQADRDDPAGLRACKLKARREHVAPF